MPIPYNNGFVAVTDTNGGFTGWYEGRCKILSRSVYDTQTTFLCWLSFGQVNINEYSSGNFRFRAWFYLPSQTQSQSYEVDQEKIIINGQHLSDVETVKRFISQWDYFYYQHCYKTKTMNDPPIAGDNNYYMARLERRIDFIDFRNNPHPSISIHLNGSF